MLLAQVILPLTGIKAFPQGLTAVMIFRLGGQHPGGSRIPVGPTENVPGDGKSGALHVPPAEIMAALHGDVVQPQQIPGAESPEGPGGKSVGIVLSADAA